MFEIWNEIIIGGEDVGNPVEVTKDGKELRFSTRQMAIDCKKSLESKMNTVCNSSRMIVRRTKAIA